MKTPATVYTVEEQMLQMLKTSTNALTARLWHSVLTETNNIFSLNDLHICPIFDGQIHMITSDSEVSDLSWIKSMMKNELDLRPPSLIRTTGNSKIIRDEQENPIAHVAITNRWQGSEINSLVVDPSHRGKGLSHELIAKVVDYRVLCYTRDARLQSALIKAGFKRAIFPGTIACLNLLLTRTAIFSWMLLTLDFKRIFHQIRHLPNYKLYTKTNP